MTKGARHQARGMPMIVGIFIYDSHGTKMCQGVSILVVWSFEYIVSWFVWVDQGALDKINCILYLQSLLVPKLNGEIYICGAKEGAKELILKHLDGLFSSIDAMIAGFNKLQFAFLGGNVWFYCLRCLIIHHCLRRLIIHHV